MKSTKRILSAILSVVMILGCLTVGFTAQASASDLVAAVAKGGNVNWTGGNVTLTDTLVIGDGVNIDFNGAVITGPAGKVAIRVKGDATLYDGVVIADQGSYSGETGFVKALMNYKPAICVESGNVELNCITAVGSLLRIPNSGTIEVPIGNGINANGGNVTLDNVIAIGMKALDNTNATVTVKDAILAGIYKAVNIYNKVDFGANYEQYETVELLEGFLNDGVTLSANEKKYIASATNSQGDFSVGSVIVNVEKPVFTQPATTFVNGTLNVIADVEPFEHAGVSNRYSYSYTPDTATIAAEIDDPEVDFKADGAQYVASFNGLTAGEEYDVTVNYDLSIKLGKKQKEIVEKAFAILEHYIDKAPELLNRFVVDFEHIYKTAEDLVALVYNAYFGTGSEFDGYVTDELKKVDCIDDIIALIYALEGQEFAGSADGVILNNRLLTDHYKRTEGDYAADDATFAELESYVKGMINDEKIGFANLYGAIFDTDDVEGPDSVFAYFNDETFEMKATFAETEFAKGTPGYGSGKGLLDVFNEYYNAVLGKLYVKGSTTEFAVDGVANAAKYIGENWQGIYELVENAVIVLDKANEILDSGAFEKVLTLIGKSSFASYISAFDTAYKYVDKVMNRVDEALDSDFVNTYLSTTEKAGKYCYTYAKKVWNIANNPETYFDITVPEGTDYVVVDLLDEDLNKTFTVKAEEQIKDVYVQVQIAGFGSAIINGVTVDSPVYSDEIWFELGEEITVTPVGNEKYGTKFAYMTVDNGGGQLVVGEDFTTKAATNLLITVVFQEEEVDYTNVVFMTDEALNYKYIDSIDFYSGDDWSDQTKHIVAPDFTKMDQLDWSLEKNAEKGEPLANFADDAQAAVEAGDDVMILYAIYDYEENTTVGEHGQTVKFTEDTPYSDGEKVYFELSIQLRDTKRRALEAGIILTAINDDAAMTVDKSYENSGYVFVRTDEFDSEGFVKSDVLLTVGVETTKTIYARGYVVWSDGSVTYTTNVVSGSVKTAA